MESGGQSSNKKAIEFVRSMGLPNLITLARLLAVPLVIWLILAGRMTPAFWIFVMAGISDAADGFFAKRFNCETEFGRYLDPVADKALLVSVYVALGHAGFLPIWLVILVVFRDALIVGGIIFLRLVNGPVRLQPLFISKLNTTMQIVLAAFMLAILGLEVPDFGLIEILTFVVAATTVASGVAYVMRWGLEPAGVSPGRLGLVEKSPLESASDDRGTGDKFI
jgi:cardiolipin synthase (CMP-forming)